jgi:hypothetical protein
VRSPLSLTARRARTLALAGALAAGGLLLAPAPSEAGAVLGLTQLGGDVNFNYNSGTCTETGPGDASVVSTFAANGVPVTKSVASTATITNTGNAADVTHMSASSKQTVTATSAGGQVNHVHIATSAAASVSTAVASTGCDAYVQADGITEFQFNLPADTLVTVSGRAHRMIGIFEAGNLMGPSTLSDVQAVVSYNIGGASSATGLLRAGTGYIAISQSELEVDAADTASTVSSSGDVAFDVTFSTPGVASSTQFGSGGKYVALAGGRSCPSGNVDLTWTKKAGTGKHRAVTKATVLVNGHKVATVKKPKKKQVTHLSGISPEAGARVQVVLKVKGKGELYTDRSYLQCS